MGVNFYRRRKTDKVYVYYKDPKTGKPKQVKRKLTEGWDKLNDDEVEQRVKEWADKNGHVVENTVRRVVLETDKLNTLWTQYQEQKAGDFTESTGRRAKTIKAETGLFIITSCLSSLDKKKRKTLSNGLHLCPSITNTSLANI